MKKMRKFLRLRKPSGQSFVELALLLPLLLLMLAGMAEVAFGMFAYLSALDLTREAARFASIRDYNEQIIEFPDPQTDPPTPAERAACTDDVLHFYYDAACFFTDPQLNHNLEFRQDKFDDVVITVYTIANNNVSQRHPASGYWSLYNDNWKKDCQGNVVRNDPVLTDDYIESKFANNATSDRGIVLIEAWVCYELPLNLPFISDFIPSPFRIHTYTLMPAPEALPTPTAIPNPTATPIP